MKQVQPNSSISLGEVVIWSVFDGEVQASLHAGQKKVQIDRGKRWTVPSDN